MFVREHFLLTLLVESRVDLLKSACRGAAEHRALLGVRVAIRVVDLGIRLERVRVQARDKFGELHARNVDGVTS